MSAPRAVECSVKDEWATPTEKSCYATTPDYDETMAYLKRVQAAAPGQQSERGLVQPPELLE